MSDSELNDFMRFTDYANARAAYVLLNDLSVTPRREAALAIDAIRAVEKLRNALYDALPAKPERAVTTIRPQLRAERDKVAALVDVLKDCEWSGGGVGFGETGPYCPSCGNFRDGDGGGHELSCNLKKAITEATTGGG